MNFILTEMTFLRYFIPLILEGNKRGVSSKVFWSTNTKYSNPSIFLPLLKNMSMDYGFDLLPISAINDYADVTFMVEGAGLSNIRHKGRQVVITATMDFITLYPKYIDKVDNVVLCSKFFAEHYGVLSEKNLYLGSPKYDVQFDKDEIAKKYNIRTKKNALFIHPNFHALERRCGHKKINVVRIHKYLNRMGYTVIVKARGKAKAEVAQRGDKYIEDFSWFPHDTMELIEIADIVIILGSTTAKECVMMNQPFVNFCIALDPVDFVYLYNYDYCRILDPEVGFDEFSKAIVELLSKDHSNAFEEARKKHLFESGNVSTAILDIIL